MARLLPSTVSDPLFASLLSALDVVVFERLPNSVFMQLTPSPLWFVQSFSAATQGEAITLSQAFPFLESFLTEAEAFWRQRQPHPLRSEVFSTTAMGGEVLLRATAATIAERRLMVIERLIGVADPRVLLQRARERELEHERLTARVAKLHGPLAALDRAVADLVATQASPAPRALLESIARLAERVRAALEMPGVPKGSG